jgi:putative aldouronate transport system permease protein
MSASANMLKKRAQRKLELPLHIMLIPGIIVVFIYSYLPMLGIVMAFQKFSPALSFWGSKFVGWKNFSYIFLMPEFNRALWNSLYLSMLKIIFGISIPLLLSILINEVGFSAFKRTVQTSIFLPFFLSWAVLGGIIQELFSLFGPINHIIVQIFGNNPIYFMGDNHWFPAILVGTDVWKGAGYNTIIFLAAITNIDPTLYEAAEMDGCGKFRQATHITLPGMAPMIILLSTLSIGSLLNAGFEQVFILYNPLVYDSSDIIDTLVYRIGLINGQLSPAAAIGLFKSVISLVLVGLSYFAAYKYSDYRIF